MRMNWFIWVKLILFTVLIGFLDFELYAESSSSSESTRPAKPEFPQVPSNIKLKKSTKSPTAPSGRSSQMIRPRMPKLSESRKRNPAQEKELACRRYEAAPRATESSRNRKTRTGIPGNV